jgi:hypothetical protein
MKRSLITNKEILELTKIEVLELFDKFYFLETSRDFLKCDKKTHTTVEVLSKEEMAYLNKRYKEISNAK